MDLYLDMPALPRPDTCEDDVSADSESPEALNIPLLETILRSPLFSHIYYNLSYRKAQPTLRPLIRHSANPLRRTTREGIHPELSMLHCLLQPDFDQSDPVHRTHRGHLRETVYNGANFTEKNDWAPLTPEGRVDWALLDAISSVMSE